MTPSLIDDKGEVSDEDVIFEDYVLFYNPAKSRFDEEDYLVTISYEPKKGLSREFLAYFAAVSYTHLTFYSDIYVAILFLIYLL